MLHFYRQLFTQKGLNISKLYGVTNQHRIEQI